MLVMVVEGEALVGQALARTVQDLGYAVCAVVASGEAAVAVAAERRPDLVLMDVDLAGPMTGLDAALRIRAAQPARVVFVTARRDRITSGMILAARPFGMLTKPFGPAELERIIRRAAALPRPAVARASPAAEVKADVADAPKEQARAARPAPAG